jgi:sulfate permease, SulP family
LLVGGNTMALDRLQNLGALASIEDADILPDVDRAIERAEDDLLRAEPRLRHTEVPLTTVGLFAGFGQSELDAIEPLLRRAHYEKGSVIFREGDPGDELLIVTNGTASAYLQLPQMNVRLASFAPGTMFGELALLDQGPRSATVIADEELVCYALSKANFAVLAATVPDVAIRLVAAIGRELSGRLRGANRTIHQLET